MSPSRRGRARARAAVAAGIAVLLGAGAMGALANALTVSSGHLDAKVTTTSLTTSTTSTTPGALTFSVTAPSPAVAGTAFDVTVQALVGGLPDATFTGQKCVTFSGPGNAPDGTAPTYPAQGTCAAGQSSVTFGVGGSATVPATLFRAQAVALTATSGTRTGTSGSIAVDSKGVTLSFGTCPKTHPKGTTQTYTLSVPNDDYDNPFTSAAGLTVNLSLTGADVANYRFVPNNTQARSLTVTTGPANNTFDVNAEGAKKNATLNGTTTATGFTAPTSCDLNGTT